MVKFKITVTTLAGSTIYMDIVNRDDFIDAAYDEYGVCGISAIRQ